MLLYTSRLVTFKELQYKLFARIGGNAKEGEGTRRKGRKRRKTKERRRRKERLGDEAGRGTYYDPVSKHLL
jgi:hypothetical protein